MRARVWDLPVRVIHWLLVLALVWVTWVKTIHEFTAYVFIALIVARVMWLFTSPSPRSRWTEWVPLSRARRRQIIPSLRFYLFLDREPPPVVGHNPLAGMTYCVLYTMFGVEVFTASCCGASRARAGRRPSPGGR